MSESQKPSAIEVQDLFFKDLFSKSRFKYTITISIGVFLFFLFVSKIVQNDVVSSAFLSGHEVLCISEENVLIKLDNTDSYLTSDNRIITRKNHKAYDVSDCNYILNKDS